MSKWLNLLHEIEKGENGGFEPMSVLSVDNSGVYKKINTQDRLIKNSSVSANVSLSVCPKTPFFNFNFNKKNILKSPQQRTDKTDIGGFPKFFEKENKLSFEDIVVDVTRYRSVLEQTYIDADHDDWHRDGMPQKFRASDHTYDEMKIALARFIQRVHQLKGQSELAWKSCMKAYGEMPEYKVLMSAKKRQAMFAALVDNEPSKEHVQYLVNSLATS